MMLGKQLRTMMRTRTAVALALVSLTSLSACGGGSSSSPAPAPTPTPTPAANRAPVFSSAATVSVVENVTGSIYQAAASDADGDSVAFTLAGADAARFALTSTGQLTFVASPNFDLPVDADRDNVYRVDVTATDGKASTVLALAVTVTNSREGIAVRRIATGFTDPVAISPISDTAMLVGEKSGAVYLFNPQTGARTLLIRIQNIAGAGLTALVAAPNFATTGTFFAMYATTGDTLIINRFLRNSAGPTVLDYYAVAVASAPDYAGGGWLGYDEAGDLIAAVGDAGVRSDPTGSAQRDDTLLGKLLRIRPNPDPYAGTTAQFFIVSRIGKGLHRPNGGSGLGGGLMFADRGQDVADELNLLPAGAGFANFGWPYKEGTRVVLGAPPAGLVDPVLEYFRTGGLRTGQAIVGGSKGPDAVPSLVDHYVFGDGAGAIFSVPVASLVAGKTLASEAIERRDADFAPDQGTIERPVMFVRGPGGTFYILDGDGEIFAVVAG